MDFAVKLLAVPASLSLGIRLVLLSSMMALTRLPFAGIWRERSTVSQFRIAACRLRVHLSTSTQQLHPTQLFASYHHHHDKTAVLDKSTTTTNTLTMTLLAPPPSSSSSSMTTTALSITSLESTIQRMLSHPQTFNGFIDILKLPVVQATLSSLTTNGVSSDPQKQRRHDALIRTVELFAYGTVGEYHDLIDNTTGGGGSHPPVWTLNEVMLEKLRMLTVVSVVSRRLNGEEEEDDDTSTKCGGGGGDDVEMKMADAALCERTVSMHTKTTRNTQMIVMGERKKDSNHGSNSRRKSPSRADNYLLSIPYSRLALELRMTNDGDDRIQETKNIRQLEDLLIKCIYSNIISAKLDQLTQCLIVQPHLMLVAPDGDVVVGLETFFAPSSSSADVDYEAGAERKDGGGSSRGGGGGGIAQGAVYGSILSRDLHTITPDATAAEITRMSSSLQRFLSRSNSLLETLENLSGSTLVKHRKEDEGRWAEVRKVVEEAPSRMRDMASPSTQSAFASSSYSAAAIGASPGTGERGMRVGWGMGRGGTSGGSGSGGGGGGGENLRQVKRSKGGHSMMMNIMGGGGV